MSNAHVGHRTLRTVGRMALAAIAFAPAALAPVAVESQGTECLQALHGRWVGPGTVLGRSISMEQDWSPALRGAFTELRMRHVAPDSSARVSFEGRGLYRATRDSVTGSWHDLRGITFSVAGRCAGDTFTSTWSGVERGRTTYLRRGDTLVVIDSVWPAASASAAGAAAPGPTREFGRSVLRRDALHAQERIAVQALVDSALAAITRRDFVALTDLMLDEAVTFSARERSGAVVYNSRTKAQERASAPSGSLSERGFDATVLVSGPLAMAWVPYDLYRNGAWSHCGVDAFSLLKVAGRWRIATLVWSVEQPPACRKHPAGPPAP